MPPPVWLTSGVVLSDVRGGGHRLAASVYTALHWLHVVLLRLTGY